MRLLGRMSPPRPSPLQNRVAPDGSLHAVPERGLLMGNRGGRLHRPDGTLGRARWRSRAWIACLTEFRGRHRAVMGDGYTELFFLDEATALAAGHRPCFECRRAAARAFAAAWGHAGAARAPRWTGCCTPSASARRERLPLRRRCRRARSSPPTGGFHLQDARRARWPGASPATARRPASPPTRSSRRSRPRTSARRSPPATGRELHPSAQAQLSAR